MHGGNVAKLSIYIAVRLFLIFSCQYTKSLYYKDTNLVPTVLFNILHCHRLRHSD